jgi:two-component system, NarL family, response regulator FusR
MNDGTTIDLLILDDHAIVRQGLMALLASQPGIVRCRGAASLDEAIALMESSPANAAVVDLSLGLHSGLAAIEALLDRWPALAVVVLTMHADPVHRERALRRGAMGFVAKDDASDELTEALRHAMAGKRYLSTAVRSRRAGGAPGDDNALPLNLDEALAQLTGRERQVLMMIGRGCSVAEVAEELGRSVKTVEAHRNNLREKLGLRNNRQLLQLSARWSQLEGSL